MQVIKPPVPNAQSKNFQLNTDIMLIDLHCNFIVDVKHGIFMVYVVFVFSIVSKDYLCTRQ